MPLRRLDDLWVMAGSLCNLACIHCYVDSSPRNGDLEPITEAEVRGVLSEGARHGLRHVYVTGGEPFVNPDAMGILSAALEEGREATVLTNATGPLAKVLDRFLALAAASGGRLHARVSLDHYDEVRHDMIRGEGRFRGTVETAVRLARGGMRPIVTLTAEVFRGNPASRATVEARVRALFAGRGADVDVKILPAVLPMGAQLRRMDPPSAAEPPVTAEAIRLQGIDPAALMCATGRSVLKRAGRLRFYPCPILYEVSDFDLGGTLEEAMAREVPLAHAACAVYCCKGRGTCANG